MSNDPDKNTDPSPEQQVDDRGNIVPVLDDVEENDDAEPADAETRHTASEEQVEESA